MTATGGAGEPSAVPLARPAPVHGPRWWEHFPGEECQLSAVRQWLASLLPDCPARDDVNSIATELASNAIRHTASGQGGSFAVGVTLHKKIIRVAVADGGSPGTPRIVNDPEGEHGRGLLLVRGLATRIGMCGSHQSRVVWADVHWEDAAAAAPPRASSGSAAGSPAGCATTQAPPAMKAHPDGRQGECHVGGYVSDTVSPGSRS